MASAPARRRQVAYARGRGLTERRACALMTVARSAVRYESKMQRKDAPVLAAMSLLSAQYPRYGYRRIQVFLERPDVRPHSSLGRRTPTEFKRLCISTTNPEAVLQE